jgi:hypothetical protein
VSFAVVSVVAADPTTISTVRHFMPHGAAAGMFKSRPDKDAAPP